MEASLKPKTVNILKPYLKTYEIYTIIQSFLAEFKRANKQFSFIEILSVYDKSDQYNTLYDSYNYSISNETKFDLANENDAFLM